MMNIFIILYICGNLCERLYHV